MPDELVTLTAACGLCSWSARQHATPEDAERVERFLRAAFRLHVERSHITITQEPPPRGTPAMYNLWISDRLRGALLDILSERTELRDRYTPPPLDEQLFLAFLDAKPHGFTYPNCKHIDAVCITCGKRLELPLPEPPPKDTKRTKGDQ